MIYFRLCFDLITLINKTAFDCFFLLLFFSRMFCQPNYIIRYTPFFNDHICHFYYNQFLKMYKTYPNWGNKLQLTSTSWDTHSKKNKEKVKKKIRQTQTIMKTLFLLAAMLATAFGMFALSKTIDSDLGIYIPLIILLRNVNMGANRQTLLLQTLWLFMFEIDEGLFCSQLRGDGDNNDNRLLLKTSKLR